MRLLHALRELRCPRRGASEKLRKRLPVVGLAEGLHRGVAAAAPRARVDLVHHDALAPEPLARAGATPRALRGEVSLRGAVVQPVALRIAEAGLGGGVTDEGHVAAGAKRGPGRMPRRRRTGAARSARAARRNARAARACPFRARALAVSRCGSSASREAGRARPHRATGRSGVSLSTTPGSSSASFEESSPCDMPSFSAIAAELPGAERLPGSGRRRWAGCGPWTPSCRRGCPSPLVLEPPQQAREPARRGVVHQRKHGVEQRVAGAGAALRAANRERNRAVPWSLLRVRYWRMPASRAGR